MSSLLSNANAILQAKEEGIIEGVLLAIPFLDLPSDKEKELIFQVLLNYGFDISTIEYYLEYFSYDSTY